jgi:hypothetical protein
VAQAGTETEPNPKHWPRPEAETEPKPETVAQARSRNRNRKKTEPETVTVRVLGVDPRHYSSFFKFSILSSSKCRVNPKFCLPYNIEHAWSNMNVSSFSSWNNPSIVTITLPNLGIHV